MLSEVEASPRWLYAMCGLSLVGSEEILHSVQNDGVGAQNNGVSAQNNGVRHQPRQWKR